MSALELDSDMAQQVTNPDHCAVFLDKLTERIMLASQSLQPGICHWEILQSLHLSGKLRNLVHDVKHLFPQNHSKVQKLRLQGFEGCVVLRVIARDVSKTARRCSRLDPSALPF